MDYTKNYRLPKSFGVPDIEINASLIDVLSIIKEKDYCLIKENGKFVGILTKEDLIKNFPLSKLNQL